MRDDALSLAENYQPMSPMTQEELEQRIQRLETFVHTHWTKKVPSFPVTSVMDTSDSSSDYRENEASSSRQGILTDPYKGARQLQSPSLKNESNRKGTESSCMPYKLSMRAMYVPHNSCRHLSECGERQRLARNIPNSTGVSTCFVPSREGVARRSEIEFLGPSQGTYTSDSVTGSGLGWPSLRLYDA
ncbi:hypothetical protein ACLB2K_008390 [Fragaria x ananassa]